MLYSVLPTGHPRCFLETVCGVAAVGSAVGRQRLVQGNNLIVCSVSYGVNGNLHSKPNG